MSKYILPFSVLCIVILLLIGCQNETGVIQVIENLKGTDINKICIKSETNVEEITEHEDISICLAGLQSIELTQKSGSLPQYSRDFEIILKNGRAIVLKFYMHQLCVEGVWYSFNEKENPLVNGFVQLSSQGKEYTPYEHWVYSQDYDGLCADGVWFGLDALSGNDQLKKSLEKLETIPYSDDFTIKAVWEVDPLQVQEIGYSVYDKDLNRLSQVNQIPEDKGLYYIAIHAQWGTSYRYEGYQYIFKVKK